MSKQADNQELSQARKWLRKIQLLDRRVELEQETRDFKSGGTGRFVLYTVDTDIVMCYSSPWNLGSGAKSKTPRPASSTASTTPYGVIFPPDENDNEAASAITYTIARYIFFHLDPQWPIFQLPAHSAETKQVFDAVARKSRLARMQVSTLADQLEAISEEVTKKFNLKTNQVFSQLSAMDKSAELGKTVESILDKLEPLMVGMGKSPVAELEHYLQLLIEGALLSTDEAPDLFGKVKDLDPLSETLVAEGISDWIKEAENRKRWTTLLENAHPKPRKKSRREDRWAIRLEADANALARLSTINRKLEPLGGRMILITGAPALHKAAEEWGSGFSRKYIRHFHSFVPYAFREVENAEKQPGKESYNALRDILGYRALSNDQKNLDKRLRSVLKKAKKAFVDIEQDWISFRKQVVRSSVTLSEDSVKRIVDAFDSLRNSLESRLQPTKLEGELRKLAESIREEMLNTRLSLAEEFAKTGIEYLQTGKRSGARNPPNIRFESYENADHLFCLFRGTSDLAKITIRAELGKLKDDCFSKKVGITDLGYLHFLVFSGIFATLNRWSVAADLAGHAIEIAKQEPETKKNSNISGREAYYLLASSLRLGARSLDDFNLARERLKNAYEALAKDKKIRPELSISKRRFDAERVAVNIGEWHFLSSRNKRPYIPEETLDRIEKELDDALEQEKDDHALIVQYAINGLQVISLLLQELSNNNNNKKNTTLTEDHWKANFLQAVEKYRDKIEKFHNVRESVFHGDNNEHLQRTYLMNAYWLFADILLAITNPERRTGLTRRKIESEFSEPKIQLTISTVYDAHRYKKLRDQCLKIFEFVQERGRV